MSGGIGDTRAEILLGISGINGSHIILFLYIFLYRLHLVHSTKAAMTSYCSIPETGIRPAVSADCGKITDLAIAAYARYLERMDKKPAPMVEDYAQRIAEGCVFVLETRTSVSSAIAGFIVLLPGKDALLLDNVAVAPAAQGHGYGKMLMAFAEKHASESGFRRISLYTNEAMAENLQLYSRLGYTETHRAQEAGFNRIFFSKAL